MKGLVSGNEAIFQGEVVFNGAMFQNASFDNVKFEYVAFDKSQFENASFSNAKFENASFIETKFQNELNLQDTKFFFKGNITTDLTNTKFHRAELENVAFIDCDWPEKVYEEVHKILSSKELETIYRNLKQNMQRTGDYSKAGKFFYREMEMKRKGAKRKRDRAWLELYRLLAGYGERPQNTIAVSLFIISIFAWLYKMLGCLQYTVINPCLSQQIIDALYFSFVTFTTLGLGDICPVTGLGKILICCEAVVGAFLIALFVMTMVLFPPTCGSSVFW